MKCFDCGDDGVVLANIGYGLEGSVSFCKEHYKQRNRNIIKGIWSFVITDDIANQLNKLGD
jgi:hypothetical protein